jgi:hypothetical protein
MSLKFNSLDAQAVAPVCQVTTITTATGTVVIAGSLQTGAGAGTQGQNVIAFYGVNVLVPGANSISVYSVNGTGTQLLGIGTATAVGLTASPAGLVGIGAAASGALVAVLGTGSGTMNVLWQ